MLGNLEFYVVFCSLYYPMSARTKRINGWYLLENSKREVCTVSFHPTICIDHQTVAAAPQTSIAIVSSITQFAPEPSRLDRYRNELAAGLLGIPATRANTEGLLSLQKLAATAPDPMSDVVFLPQLRAINVMKACQQWIASDEDIDEEVESEMTLIFFHLAPILQNVSGAHWEFVFDVIENNLEVSQLHYIRSPEIKCCFLYYQICSFTDDTTLVTLARTLRLIVAIQDLALSTKTLRADWEERQISILTLVRDLVTEKSGRSLCSFRIVQNLIPKQMPQEFLHLAPRVVSWFCL
jgi:hypothetical protein